MRRVHTLHFSYFVCAVCAVFFAPPTRGQDKVATATSSKGADPELHVVVDVVVDVDDQRHNLLSICTTLSRVERPAANRAGLVTLSTLHASRIAAHSIAEPRAIA